MLLRILLAVLLAATLWGQGADPVGTWDIKSSTPNGNEVPGTIEVARQDGKLTVKLNSSRGEMPAQEARMDGDTLAFDITVGEGKFEIRLNIKGNQLEGTWKGNDQSGTMKGSRK